MSPPKSTGYPLYQPRMSPWWWLRNRKYFLFMMRELSAVFIAFFVVTYLVGIYRLGQGEESYQLYLNALQTPLAKTLFIVTLLFSTYHTLTWFHLTPVVMVIRIGQKVLHPALVLVANYLGWFLISALLFYLLVAI